MCAKSLQLFPTLCNTMDCSQPGSFVHGILQVKILDWLAMPLLQGIFLTQESNPDLLQWQAGSLSLAPSGKHQLCPHPCFNIDLGEKMHYYKSSKHSLFSSCKMHWQKRDTFKMMSYLIHLFIYFRVHVKVLRY